MFSYPSTTFTTITRNDVHYEFDSMFDTEVINWKQPVPQVSHLGEFENEAQIRKDSQVTSLNKMYCHGLVYFLKIRKQVG